MDQKCPWCKLNVGHERNCIVDWPDVEKFKYLLTERDRYKTALEKIAKPALGGKQQQWIAKEALSRSTEKGMGGK